MAIVALAARLRGVAGVHEVQTYARHCGLVGNKGTQLIERPGGMTVALRLSNRAISALPDVP